MDDLHEENRRRWNAAAAGWANKVDALAHWEHAHREPQRVLLAIEREILGRLDGDRACVLGSGDNLAAFALCGLGAAVTSVDISERQLAIATQRAEASGLAMEFVRADVCDVPLPDDTFDVVYTGGHVAVWVSDLFGFYAQAVRILKPGGLLLINEYHPVRRIWRDDSEALVVERSYFDRGPHSFPCAEHLFDPTPGALTQHEFQWTIADFVKAIVRAGANLERLEEFGDESEGWETSPLEGLPLHVLFAARKGA